MSGSRVSPWGVLVFAVACGDDGGRDTSPSAPTSLEPSNGSTTGATGGPSTGIVEPTGGTTGGVLSISTTNPGTTTSPGETTVDPTSTEATASSTGDGPCPADKIVCDGTTAQVCDGLGGFKSEEVCPIACAPDLGCVTCVPGATECQGNDVYVCNEQGTGSELDGPCDPLQGLVCDPQANGCVGACAGLGLSYIGCDYYPTVLQQIDGFNDPPNVFAVAVANTSAQAAQVTITRGANPVSMVMVPPGDVQVVTLPWVDELTKGTGPSVVVVDGAYRLRSDQPVTVYQYNPLQSTTTNDASVLLPVNTWTGNYLVAAWQQWSGYPGFYAVVAREDGTTVTLLPSATGKVIQAGGGVAADGTGVVVLNEGDVLQVIAGASDVTGTIVQADRPVQVFGGHDCTNVPVDIAACDHLEESMFPIETLATEYVVVPPVQVPNDTLDKAQMVRVIASQANTTLTFTPDQPVNKLLTNAGDWVELATTTARFIVSADKKILVAQYMVGQNGGYGTSDPSMVLAVNPLQWRKNYLFHAATSWEANYADLVTTLGATVTVDGNPVAGWQPLGASNYQVAHVLLDSSGNGNHTVVGDVGVGLAVSGVQQSGSYWYPGGLNLDLIPQ